MKKRVLALFLVVIITATLIPTTASAANSDFVIEDGVLTRYKGPGGNVTIPSGVTSIGYAAFSDCTSLTSVTIPASVTSINEYRSFDGCTGLTAIHVDPNNQDYASTDGVLFTKDMKTLIDCPEGKQGRYAIPAGVTSIEWEAFADCTGLTSVVIPDSVTSFEGSAFRGCTGLTGVTISAGVTSIESNTFYRCAGLTSVTIPSGVTSIESGAFADCTSLTSVTIPSGVTSIDSSAFSGTPWLESLGKFATVNGILIKYQGKDREVTIPDNVTSISSGAFYGCTSLASVVIPDSVTSIGYGAFDSCTSLTSVTIPDSVTSIEDGTFEGCTSLTSVTIPDSVTSIGWSAFEGCTGLTSVTIPTSVTSIGSSVFSGCTSLTVYGYADSYTEQYCSMNKIPFVSIDNGYPSGAAREGVLERNREKSVSWTVTEKGVVTVPSSQLAPEEKVLVGCYDSDGRFTGVKWIDAQHATAQIDPNTPNVKLFWLGAKQNPLSPSVTVWGK